MRKPLWTLGMVLGLAQIVSPVLAAEVFNCRIGARAGIWQIDGDTVIVPDGGMRLATDTQSMTDGETQLVNQTRLYVASLPRK